MARRCLRKAGRSIPASGPDVYSIATYDGAFPALIPGHLVPAPSWTDPVGTCSWKAQDVLDWTLENSPPLTDERVLAALDLFIASQYDFLPRSLFLAKLTILDALAIRTKRNASAVAWIDQKIVEAGALFDEPGLISALQNLKNESNTESIRTLVKRAVVSLGGSQIEAKRQAKAVRKLYAVRSGLSHEGSAVDLDLAGATQLARLVLNAAVRNPLILDVDRGEDASMRSGLQQREEWIAEAGAVIRMVQPGCATVVDAIRRPLIMGRQGLLTARLADGSEWAIGHATARRLSVEEIADWAACPESFAGSS